MSDLFHPSVPDHYVAQVADVMIEANWHTFQVLTKRADRLESALNTYLSKAASSLHIWWGVSVEDKKHGIPRIQHLRKSAAVVKFLSVEPLLEDLGKLNLNGIDWVIAGGESGPGARNMEAAWVDSVRLQCESKKVAFFFKQWGGVRKAKTGRLLNGRTYDELPILQ